MSKLTSKPQIKEFRFDRYIVTSVRVYDESAYLMMHCSHPKYRGTIVENCIVVLTHEEGLVLVASEPKTKKFCGKLMQDMVNRHENPEPEYNLDDIPF